MAIIQYNTKVEGEHIDCRGVSMTIDQSSYCWSISIQLNTLDSWLACVPGNTLEINIDSVVYRFTIDSRDRTQLFNQWTYTALGRSPTSALGEGSVPIYKTWPLSMSKEVVLELAGSIVANYNVLNWSLPDGTLESDGELAIAIIKRIAEAVGGFVYTNAGGDLFIVPQYSESPALFDIGVVDRVISSHDDIHQLTETKYKQPGYNKVEVSSEPLSSTATVYLDLIEVAGLRALVRLEIYPLQPTMDLSHSSVPAVTVNSDTGNPLSETKEERVEFVDGVGNVEHVVKSITTVDYDYVDLGDVTPEGTELTTYIKGNGLATVTYETEYHKYEVLAPTEGEVQVFTGSVT